jgi:hypothetical protein
MSVRTLVLAALFVPIAAMSQALTLDCQVQTNASSGGYVTERYVFQHDDGASEAIVSDGLILYHNDNQPMTARVPEDTARKVVFAWNVQMTNSTGQMTKMQFRAAYFRTDGTLTVRAVPGGYNNSFEGRGRCRML